MSIAVDDSALLMAPDGAHDAPINRFPRRAQRLIWAAWALVAVLAAVGIALQIVEVDSGLGASAAVWAAPAAAALAVILLVVRAVAVERDRTAWAVLAFGLACWSVADIYWYAIGEPAVSLADVGYFVFYGANYVCLALLVTSRLRGLGLGGALDGAIAMLCVGAVGAFVISSGEPVEGNALETFVNFAYPVADTVLIATALVALAATGWRPGPSWLLLAAVAIGNGVVDSLYFIQVAYGEIVPDWVLSGMWTAMLSLGAFAGWLPDRATETRQIGQWRLLVMPATLAVIAIAMLTYGSASRLGVVVVTLACGALVATLVRMAVFFHELTHVSHGLVRARKLADTDPLTGLANYRAFHAGLATALEAAHTDREPLSLVLIDIDRFKDINDSMGHQIGDAVLREIGRRIRANARDGDLVARVGGEEFAWLLPGCGAERAAEIADRAREAIAHSPIAGVNRVSVSAGVCDTARAGSASDIYAYADGALYWAKSRGRDLTITYDPAVVTALSAVEEAAQRSRSQSLNAITVLAKAVDAKDPYTAQHSERVADMAVQLATAMGWSIDRVVSLREAALVHDVGKIGVPDSVLRKPGPLDDDEWAQMKEHSALGARMVDEVLDAEQVAWVRGHHERHDGRGYPDGIAGDDIPLGASIMCVADSWDAMTSDRPYRAGLPAEVAYAQCREHCGTQFRPEVVEALERLWQAGLLGDTRAAAPGVAIR